MRVFSLVIATVLAIQSAAAQTGTLDQSSPFDDGGTSAQYNTDVDFLIWQQQIRTGIAGQLEGIQIRLTGATESTVNVRVRRGAAPALDAPLFETLVSKATSGLELIFIDMSSANIQLALDEPYVLETQGTNTGVWLIGNYIGPPGTPLYDEPLYLNGAEFVPGWKHGFATYMLDGEDPCPGDTDGDHDVDLQDLANLLAHFGIAADATAADGDTDADGDVDLQDLANLLGNFGSNC